jgi:hypothetical protein
VLVLGFEIEYVNGGPVRIVKGKRVATSGILRPDEEDSKLGIKVRRRPGWEKVESGFLSG